MNLVLAIALGGALGSVLRHYAIMAGSSLMGESFPSGTLIVNVIGSFIIGLLMELMALKWSVSLELRAFMITGILGGFTTFSAFSLDVFKLAETGHPLMAAGYAAASVIVSILAVFSGVYAIRAFA